MRCSLRQNALQPASNAMQPASNAVQPESYAVQPASNAVQLASNAVQPASNAVQPVSNAVQPASNAVQPASNAVQPTSKAVQPEPMRSNPCRKYVKSVLQGGVVGGGSTHFIHGHSRTTTNPRIPTVAGQGTSGLHRPGRHHVHQAQSDVRRLASRAKGELHPTKNHLLRGLPHLLHTFLNKDDSFEINSFVLVSPLKEMTMCLLCNCLVNAVSYAHYVMPCPLHGVEVLPSAQYGRRAEGGGAGARDINGGGYHHVK